MIKGNIHSGKNKKEKNDVQVQPASAASLCATTFDAGGILDPKDALSCLFRRGTPDMSAAHLISQSKKVPFTVDAVGHGRNVLYDQTLARNAGIGRLYNQTLLQLSRAPSAARLMRPCWRSASASNRSEQYSEQRPTSAVLRCAACHSVTASHLFPLPHLLPRSVYLVYSPS